MIHALTISPSLAEYAKNTRIKKDLKIKSININYFNIESRLLGTENNRTGRIFTSKLSESHQIPIRP